LALAFTTELGLLTGKTGKEPRFTEGDVIPSYMINSSGYYARVYDIQA